MERSARRRLVAHIVGRLVLAAVLGGATILFYACACVVGELIGGYETLLTMFIDDVASRCSQNLATRVVLAVFTGSTSLFFTRTQ